MLFDEGFKAVVLAAVVLAALVPVITRRGWLVRGDARFRARIFKVSCNSFEHIDGYVGDGLAYVALQVS